METSLARLARWPRRAVRFLAVSDPGQLRLRGATQTTLSLVVALAALLVVTHLLSQPVTVAMLGTVVAMFSSFVVKDRTAHARLLTTALVAVPAIAAMICAAVLSRYGVLADVAFIAVLFTAAWVRRFGPRGFALGMGAFIAYFFALFLKAGPAQIPVLAASIVIGVACAVVVRAVFQREWAGAELSRLTRALRAAASRVVDLVDPPEAAPHTPRHRLDGSVSHESDHRGAHELPPVAGTGRGAATATRLSPPSSTEVRRELERLANTALMIEDWLDRNVAAAHLSVTGNDLSRRVFDAQQATEQLTFAMRDFDVADAPAPVRDVLAAVRTTLRDDPSDGDLRMARRVVTRAESVAVGSDQDAIVVRTAARAVRAHIAVHRVTAHALSPNHTGEPADLDPESDDPESNDPEPADAELAGTDGPGPGDESRTPTNESAGPLDRLRRWTSRGFDRLEPSTRTAVQVAIATSVATVVGELVSPDRWYWAVLSAFVVFTGTTTRGEILTRAGHRIVGTAAGVAAGVMLAALVGHRPPLQLALIVVCVFCAFYLVSVANALLVFFVTVLLAMLYGLLGTFSVAVLELRVEETCVGATVGLLAAYFVLPTRTRETVRARVDDYLEAIDELIDSSVDSVLDPGSGADLVPVARRLDTALQALQTAAKPLAAGSARSATSRPALSLGPASRARRTTRRLVRVLEACDRAAHALARAGILASSADPATRPSADTADALRDGAASVRESLGALRAVVRGDQGEYDESLADESPVSALLARDPADLTVPTRVAVRALDRLDHSTALTRVPL